MTYRIGVDIGGTFTDFTIADETGKMFLWKEDTTPDDPSRAVITGLQASAQQLGLDTAKLLQSTEIFVHGTTVATNMLIQRNGPLIGMLTTEGFSDILYFRDGYKPERFNLKLERPKELVERWLRIGIPERINASGKVLRELDEEMVRAAAAEFRDAGVRAVAVAFLWSMVNRSHEDRAAEILAEELPGVDIVTSAQVLPEIREWERFSATAMSTYILPKIHEYLTTLEKNLLDSGLETPPLIMQINGGCARIPDILKVPVNILHSGPAAAPAAALHFSDVVGQNLVTVDMGGTSLDVCLITEGRAAMSRDIQVEDQPIGVAAVDVHSIGAGGGSIAWIDQGGALRVGPRSAGSVPGPACYDQGGVEPTVTDANVTLGYLNPEVFLGGRRVLRDDLSRQAVDTYVGEPLNLDTVEAAAGIIRVVNANMVAAIQSVSIDRGVDPRDYTLVSGGGAGGLHAADLARDLGMERVFVPLEAGVFCAFGMIVTDVKHDYVATSHQLTTAFDRDAVNRLFAELESEARAALREEGFDDSEIVLERFVDARYPSQVHELTVPVPESLALSDEDLEQLKRNFNDEHYALFAYAREELPVEFLHWRVRAIGKNARGMSPKADAQVGSPEPIANVQAYSASDGGMVPTPVYDVHEIGLGGRIEGPAIIAAPTTTIVIHSGDVLERSIPQGFVISVALDK